MLATNLEVALIIDGRIAFTRGSNMARHLSSGVLQKVVAAPLVRGTNPIPAGAEYLLGEFGEDES
ncbi:MAG: hypothetical protein ACRETA_07280 [Gammaproteobacteria bacterium]